jgi:membrane protein involved in colicin uptake
MDYMAPKARQLVLVEKDGQRIKVHPHTLEAHKRLGWVEVKAEAEVKAKAETEAKTKADAEAKAKVEAEAKAKAKAKAEAEAKAKTEANK